MRSTNRPLWSVLKSGLAYGVGLTVGFLITNLLYRNVDPELFRTGSTVGRLVMGIVLALVFAGIGSGFGGTIGGLTLDLVRETKDRWGYAWRSGMSVGVVYGALLYPVLLVISLFSFYNIFEQKPLTFGILFAIFGVVFGSLSGLSLGLLTVGRRRFWWVTGAGALGFGLGGFGLGYGLYGYIFSVSAGDVRTGQYLWGMLGLFCFGALGGAAWGYVYNVLANEPPWAQPLVHPLSQKVRFYIVGTVLIVIVVVLFRPVTKALGDMLTPRDAGLSSMLVSNTIGTHWLTSLNVSDAVTTGGNAGPPGIAAGPDGRVALVWPQEIGDGMSDVHYAMGDWAQHTNETQLVETANVSNSSDRRSTEPQAALDSQGRAHVVWVEEANGGGSEIGYSLCENALCTVPVRISHQACAECGTGAMTNDSPSIAIDDADNLMVVWRLGGGALYYSTWSAGEGPPITAVGFIPRGAPAAGPDVIRRPRLAAGSGNRFAVVYDTQSGAIFTSQYAGGEWDAASGQIAEGKDPEVYVDPQDGVHVAWCGVGDQVYHWTEGQMEVVSALPCISRPALGLDSENRLHVVWYSNLVENAYGYLSSHDLLYETVEKGDGWTPPAIVARPGAPVEPALAADPAGTLFLAWTGDSEGRQDLFYATQVQYGCQEAALSDINQVVYDIARQEQYRPAGTLVPYCGNRYDTLVYMPNPDPAFSDKAPAVHGGYSDLVELAEGAEYEVLFSTMWYKKDETGDSPGVVIAEAVAELQRRLKENPSQYPRGMTVRILLGNPPELAIGEFSDQLWNVLRDLRTAGVTEMTNEEIGWNLEVANFHGALPHSHTKMMVVDGKKAVGAGFNMDYAHYPADHPSGKGAGRWDLGIQVTGPAAQDAQLAFDDLWKGADQRHCSDLGAKEGAWQKTCVERVATDEHVPEVLKYYLPDGTANVFSMNRTKEYDEADHQIVEAIASAGTSVDVVQVNFTMPLICDLNILYDVCTFDDAMPYLAALVKAAGNGAHVRVLAYPHPVEAIESTIAVDLLVERLVELGLEDRFEIRLFEGPMHYKGVLIDDEFLIVGSQNFHYSAFGTGAGLTEYSLGTDDPQAVEDFARLYNYHWERAVPIEVFTPDE